MNRLLLAVTAVAVLVGGCSRQSDPGAQEATSLVTVTVVDGSGLPAQGVQVAAEQMVAEGVNEQVGELTTDDAGRVQLEFPENVTAHVGLWKNKDVPAAEVVTWQWQAPFKVTVDDVSLTYQYVLPQECAVVTPGPDGPCPGLPPTDSPTATPTVE